ncbi:DegV family protein [Phytoactinopolyspora limicola]|uniref:DegV family protein n=1 Tax=Phytoactinopolyspora limicola TaxID=2715536 RepID=UPI00140B3A22
MDAVDRDGNRGGAARSRVAVVTDSTAYLSASATAAAGVEIVPLHVVVDGVSHVEGVEIGPHEVAAALRGHQQVSTSRPSPQEFLDTYRRLAGDGVASIVSIHLSSTLSGTVDAARLAAAEAPVPVEVVDSRSLCMGLGFAVLAAAEVATGGGDSADVAAAAVARSASSSAFFYVDTLEYLRRGGRIGAASAMFGHALAIKPLLYVDAGEIKPLEKVRTGARALARLEELAMARAAELTGGAPGPVMGAGVASEDVPGAKVPAVDAAGVDVAVHHLDNAVRADELAERLSMRLQGLGELVVSEVGAVIGAHVGPGLLAVVLTPTLRT